ncbi:hypothetical protein EBQ91_00600 [bacterium]|nr:hypothetical protein [bacterium]
MKPTSLDIDQRLKMLQIITDAVVHQNNPLLMTELSRFKADNVQWTLNMINVMFQQLQDALEMQDYGHYLDEG